MLILGGTTEARSLAACLAGRADLAATLSLAGRTQRPLEQPVPVRLGGFGGAEGLADHLRRNRIDLLVDATHPFAARISANAVRAAEAAEVRLLVLRRPAWTPQDGDRWTEASSVTAAVGLLGSAPRRVFAALGRQELAPLERAPQHFWLLRSVDPVLPPLAVPQAEYLLGRGPFDAAAEEGLLRDNRIDAVLCKNSGGEASHGKIAAARALGLAVFMVTRPAGGASAVGSIEEILSLIGHRASVPVERGE